MGFLLSSSPWLGALAIFVLRVLNISMDTLRFMLTMRGKQAISWVLGFIESILFVVVMGAVLEDLNNVLNIIGYAAGFATGNVIGMAIEKRLAIGYSHVSIVSRQMGLAVADALRCKDFAVTEIPARGRDGTVTLLYCSVRRKDIKEIEKAALDIDPDAFITVEDITPMQRGYWGTGSVRR
ncbi:MAG: DUF5698 domain-containing protein [Anaerolineaceae bacterium]